MPRRKRNNQGSPISLFSFQDVMTAVMGILIFITLMLALELTVNISEESEPPPPRAETELTEAELERLRVRAQRLEKQYQQKQEQIRRLRDLPGDAPEQAKAERARLVQTYERIRRLQQRVQAHRRQSAKDRRQREKRQAQARRLRKLRRERTRVESQIEQIKTNPRLTYIRQAGDDQKPLLVQLSKNRIGISRARRGRGTIWFNQGDLELRAKQLQAFLKTRDAEEERFVLLVKPSAFGSLSRGIAQLIREAGFQVGIEPIEENVNVLPGPE
jgi:chromosome segregation ATPase